MNDPQRDHPGDKRQRDINYWLGRSDPTSHLPNPGRKERRQIEKRRGFKTLQEQRIQYAIDEGLISYEEGQDLHNAMWGIISANQSQADALIRRWQASHPGPRVPGQLTLPPRTTPASNVQRRRTVFVNLSHLHNCTGAHMSHGDHDPRPLFKRLADADEGDAWFWSEERGFLVRRDGVWRAATEAEIKEIRRDRP